MSPENAWREDEPTLEALYARLHELHAAGRNGLWARIIKNAFAPVFLAPFDYVAGNPPWINWQNLPEGYRNETKRLWTDHGLFVHSGMDTILGKGKKDIAMLVTYVAADSYLKDGGKLGFVITQSLFKTSGAGQGFRRFKSRRGQPLGILFVDDFSELQLFEGATNRTAVFIMRKGHPVKYPVQYAYWRKKVSGRSGGFDYDSTLEEVTSKTERLSFVAEPVNPNDQTSPWVTGRPQVLRALTKLRGESSYRERAHQGVNTGGANAVYWFDILQEFDDGTVLARNITENAKRKVESAQVRLEKAILHPLIRGRDLCRWRVAPSAALLFVQDPKLRKGIPLGEMKKHFPLALGWLERNRTALQSRSAYKRYFGPEDPFYSMFDVGEYTSAPWRVAWRRVANELDVAVIDAGTSPAILSDSTLVEITCNDAKESFYVAGVMNSSLYRLAVANYIVLHPDIHILDNLCVPTFDSSAELHQRICTEARRLSSGAPDVDDPIHEVLDQLCSRLWGVTQSELSGVQAAFRELHVIESVEDDEIPKVEAES